MVERGDGRRRRQRHERQQRPEQDIDPEEGRVLVRGDVRALHGGRGQPEIPEPAQHAGECGDHADQPEILRVEQPRQHDDSARAQHQAGHLRSEPRRPAADGLFLQILHCGSLLAIPRSGLTRRIQLAQRPSGRHGDQSERQSSCRWPAPEKRRRSGASNPLASCSRAPHPHSAMARRSS